MNKFMSTIDKVFQQSQLFFVLATSEQEKLEKRREYYRNWRKKITEPNNPAYQEYLNRRREKYDLEQEFLGTDPEKLKEWQDSIKERQHKYLEKLRSNPAMLKQYNERRKEEHANKMRQITDSNDPLELKLFLFGRQIASKKSDDKKKQDRMSSTIYETNKQQLEKLLEFTKNVRDSKNVIHNKSIAGIMIIDKGKELLREISKNPSMQTLVANMTDIIAILNNQYNT